MALSPVTFKAQLEARILSAITKYEPLFKKDMDKSAFDAGIFVLNKGKKGGYNGKNGDVQSTKDYARELGKNFSESFTKTLSKELSKDLSRIISSETLKFLKTGNISTIVTGGSPSGPVSGTGIGSIS